MQCQKCMRNERKLNWKPKIPIISIRNKAWKKKHKKKVLYTSLKRNKRRNLGFSVTFPENDV